MTLKAEGLFLSCFGFLCGRFGIGFFDLSSIIIKKYLIVPSRGIYPTKFDVRQTLQKALSSH